MLTIHPDDTPMTTKEKVASAILGVFALAVFSLVFILPVVYGFVTGNWDLAAAVGILVGIVGGVIAFVWAVNTLTWH